MIPSTLPVRATTLDKIEKYTLCVVFTFLAYRMITGYLASGAIVQLIYLVDQAIVLAFLLLRRPTEAISTRIDDWIVGFTGTFAAMLFGPVSMEFLAPTWVLAILMAGGLLVHVGAKLSLRRSFGVVAANRGVKTSGLYRLVRHPMYLGYMMVQAGILLSGPTWNNAAVLAICWVLYIWRIEAEERILREDTSYETMPRYKLVPFIY